MLAETSATIWTSLAVNIPVAAAVIYTVRIFLEFIKGERTASDARTSKFLEVLDSQKAAMMELTIEIRQQNLLLRSLTPDGGVDVGKQ